MSDKILTLRAPNAHELIAQPGDGTRYHLVVAASPESGTLVVWPEMNYLWRAGAKDLVLLAASNTRGKVGQRYDTEAVEGILRDAGLLERPSVEEALLTALKRAP